MKSGTTLLRALLGQHPQLFATFETHWYEPDVREHWDRPDSKRMQTLRSLLELDDDEFATLRRAKEADPGREFVDIVMSYCAVRAGKHRWVEKTPNNIRHWRLIKREWPAATLIHVTREYKDVYASWKVRRGDSLETFLRAAKSAYGEIRDLMGTRTADYMEVDYLDLVRAPEATMRAVLEHIGEPWHRGCAGLDVDRGQTERRSFRQLMGRESWTLVSLSKPIFTDSIGQWREHISDGEKLAIERELAEYYGIYGSRWPPSGSQDPRDAGSEER
jgi:hypothetical protein